MRTRGGARGDNGAVEAGLGDDVNLDGGVAARVVHGPGVDLGDGHLGLLWLFGLLEKR